MRGLLLFVAVFLVATSSIPVASAHTYESGEASVVLQQTTSTPVNNSSSSNGGGNDGGGFTGFGELVDELKDFTGSWDATLEDVLKAVFWLPFLTMGQQLVNAFTYILLNTPSVYPNPGVEQVHHDVLLVSYLVSGLILTATGILYMSGPVLGVSYQEARMILPRLLAGLVFATISLPLLQYAVDFSDALVLAFRPAGLQTKFSTHVAVWGGVAIAVLVNAVLLLAVVVLLLIRDVYILFVAAIAPILAVMWSVPKARRYADTFISGFWAALLIAPAQALVLKFVFAMASGSGTGFTQHVSNWVIGTAALVLMLFVPYQLWGASQSSVGLAYAVVGGVKGRIKEKNTQQYRQQMLENTAEKKKFYTRVNRRMEENERKRSLSEPGSSNFRDAYENAISDDEDDDDVIWDGRRDGGGGA